jgi:rod shape-determining protein MreD
MLTRVALLVVTALAAHVALFHRIRVFGTAPDTMLLVSIVAALETGSELGGAVGFASGMGMDMVATGSPLGLRALIFTIVGWGVGYARDRAFPGADRVPFALVAVSSIMGTLLFGGALLLVRGGGTDALVQLGRTVGVVAVLNAVLSPLARPAVRRLLAVNWNDPVNRHA